MHCRRVLRLLVREVRATHEAADAAGARGGQGANDALANDAAAEARAQVREQEVRLFSTAGGVITVVASGRVQHS